MLREYLALLRVCNRRQRVTDADSRTSDVQVELWRCSDLLDDVLGRAVPRDLDDSVRLLGRDVVDLNQERVIFCTAHLLHTIRQHVLLIHVLNQPPGGAGDQEFNGECAKKG